MIGKTFSNNAVRLGVVATAIAFATGCESFWLPKRSSDVDRPMQPFMGMGERWTDRDWKEQNIGRESQSWEE